MTEGLQISRRLAASSPGLTQAQISVMTFLQNLAYMQLADGDLRGARQGLEEGLGIASSLAAADPSSAQAQRQVSTSLHRLGDALVAQGNTDDARRHFEESLRIARRLLAAAPDSVRAHLDVADAMWKLAGVEGASVRWADVATFYRRMSERGMLSPRQVDSIADAERRALQQH